MPSRTPKLYLEILTLHIAQFAQRSPKRIDGVVVRPRCGN